MTHTVDPARRAAIVPDEHHSGPVTLINSFVVPAGREEVFFGLWSEASEYFRAQPGYLSLNLHRALSAQAPYRFVNVANWQTARQFAAAHDTREFRDLISRTEWREFPSSPWLYEVVAQHRATPGTR